MEMIEEMKRMYMKDHNVSAVARRFGLDPQRVIKILSSEGIVINMRHKRILDLRAAGSSVEDIAKWLHISPRTVQKYLPAEKPYYIYKLWNCMYK